MIWGNSVRMYLEDFWDVFVGLVGCKIDVGWSYIDYLIFLFIIWLIDWSMIGGFLEWMVFLISFLGV